ncbi:MAG: META domain-containing protein [Ectothiorhodospiraceae bacterium]|nr:META domain-containing protein [Ectothiorhodospiraceae bacterium]
MKAWTLALPALLLVACQSPSLHQTQPPIDGTEWRVMAINEEPVEENVETTMIFGEERVMGNTGCNQYTAPVEIDRSSMNVSNAVATRMACADNIMRQESAFLQALESVKLFNRSGNSLRLYDADSNELLELRPQ